MGRYSRLRSLIANKLEGNKYEKLVQSYLDRHQSLANFPERRDTAVISIIVTDYIIARFDRVERIRIDDTFLYTKKDSDIYHLTNNDSKRKSNKVVKGGAVR